MTTTEYPVVLTIAGSDSSANAGLQADLLTFAAHEVFGTTAATCLTAQNPDGITSIEVLSPPFVEEQILQIDRYFKLRALKTGMLYTAEIIGVVAKFVVEHPAVPAVVDPVMVATSGAVLLRTEAVAALRERLLPRAALVTPNLDEVAVLLGHKPAGADDMIGAGLNLARTFGVPFLVKGGHLQGEAIVDVLAMPDGRHRTFPSRRLAGIDTHGSGCTLSAAIAANLAKGFELDRAVEAARRYLQRGLERSVAVGGRRFINHRP